MTGAPPPASAGAEAFTADSGRARYREEVGRKLIHVGSALFPILYWYTDRRTMLWLMIPLVAFALVVETARFFSPAVRALVHRLVGRILRPAEKQLLTGATYVAISILLCVLVFEKPVACTVLLFMSVSDAAASLVGIRVGGPKFFGKSVSGSAAFLVTALAVGWWMMPGDFPIALAGAVVAMVIEALPLHIGPFKVDDNLAIPLGGGIVMTWLLA